MPITGELQEAASKYGRKYGWLSGPSRSRAPDTISNSLCRTSSASPIYSRLAGYEDTNDAERLAEDPTFRILAARERRETGVALTSALHWFATDVRGGAEIRRAWSPQHRVDRTHGDVITAPAGDPRYR